jgi:NADH-quinone oxidoreductase subunit G
MPEETKAMVHLTIDGVGVTVPKGTNLIEAAATVGIDIPFYCYHRHLSIAGNCRMCQVEIEGSSKLAIACNMVATEGMIVRTHRTSPAVADAQRAILEFLLINHPLDCTVCDEAGHCKLQDYYYEYDAKPSRFIEEKVLKVKAQPFGPQVIYDGERCILCTRCVRFCQEVTKTSELAVLKRSDQCIIAVQPGQELNNALSGTVADLCPVGALTHRKWRFNTRIWFATEYDSICPGCSTGCSAKVAVRDEQIVLVRARLNSQVNQEWMCDEGRYGFERFQPQNRLLSALVREDLELKPIETQEACELAAKLAEEPKPEDTAVFLSPMLTLEEVWVSLKFIKDVLGLPCESNCVAMQLKKRELNEVERLLISPDYAPNARAVNLFGIGNEDADYRETAQRHYQALLEKVRQGQLKKVLLIGDQAILDEDLNQALINSLLAVELSVSLTPRGLLSGEEIEGKQGNLGAHQLCRVILPGRTVNEISGIMVNRDLRLQKLRALLTPPAESVPQWLLLAQIAAAAGKPILPEEVTDERMLFQEMAKQCEFFYGLNLEKIGDAGCSGSELRGQSG